MKIHYCVQLSPDWWELRRGIATASSFDRIITPGGKPSAQAEDYICELIGEQYCLTPNMFTERPMTPAMRHGVECEPEARRWYAMHAGRDVQMVGFCSSDCGRYGCSPDGLVGEEGVLELKCVQPKTQVKYLLEDTLPREYAPQVHGHLLVTGRPWVDFVSYTQGFDPLIVRVTPDDYTKKLADALAVFLNKLEYSRRQLGLPPWPGTPGVPGPTEPEAVATVEYGDDNP